VRAYFLEEEEEDRRDSVRDRWGVVQECLQHIGWGQRAEGKWVNCS
jgi:hypothetical protein